MKTNTTLLANLPKTNEQFLSVWSDTSYWERVARAILADFGLQDETLQRPKEGSNIVFQVGDDQYLKIFDPSSEGGYFSELSGLELLEDNLSIETPTLVGSGELPSICWSYVLMTKLEGELVSECLGELTSHEKTQLMRDLGRTAREVHSIFVIEEDLVQIGWHALMHGNRYDLEKRHTEERLPQQLASQVRSFVEPRYEKVIKCDDYVLLTGEYTPFNLFVQGSPGNRQLTGMFDFGDLMSGCKLYDLLGPMTFMAAGDRKLQRAFLLSYGLTEEELNDELRETFMTLLLLHRFSNLNGQIKMKDWQNAKSFEELARIVFAF